MDAKDYMQEVTMDADSLELEILELSEEEIAYISGGGGSKSVST